MRRRNNGINVFREAAVILAVLLLIGSVCLGLPGPDVQAFVFGDSSESASAGEENDFDEDFDTSTPPLVSAYTPKEKNIKAPASCLVPVKEPMSSDLKLLTEPTRLASKRWIQSFCKDSKYYYFLQMTNPYKGHLRLTRIRYKGGKKLTSDYMDLLYFGHGTNLDCSRSGGSTLLWTGGDCKKDNGDSTSITAFHFVPGKRLRRHGFINYKIPRGGSGKRAKNVFPAININNNRLLVRYTHDDAQYFQLYRLRNGRKISPKHPMRVIRVKATKGDFQGFDFSGKVIYTIEGSPTKRFLKGYDPDREFQATIIRTINYKTKKKSKKVIRGARSLLFREPEGIKVVRYKKKKRLEILFVSGTLTDMLTNIYRVK